MEVTKAFWTRAGIGAFLAVYAIVLARPLLLVGAVGIGTWLLVRQYMYIHRVAELHSSLNVAISPSRERTLTDEPVTITVAVTSQVSSPLRTEVEGTIPAAGAVGGDAKRTVTLAPGDREETTSYTVSCPVAGRHEFDRPQVTCVDREGLFRTQFQAGRPAEFVAEPRTPRNIHVGQGDARSVNTFGEHPIGQHGTGLEPEEIREYVFGDPASRIDWKTTARLGDPHVQKFEAKSDVPTVLVVDNRASMGNGRTGETKLDFVRQVALAYLEGTRRNQYSVGFYAVGDCGLTAAESPAEVTSNTSRIRLQLLNLVPGETEMDGRTGVESFPPANASRAATRLRGSDLPFGTTLRPFFDRATGYVERIDEQPLLTAVQTIETRLNDSVVTVLLTDDTHRTEIREAVKRGGRKHGRVVVFLAPSVLFEPGALAHLETAYERYRRFEVFRRSLARMDGVSAYEVGPRDRLEALLSGRPPNGG